MRMARFAHWRLLGGKKLTFLYVPDNASVRQIGIPRFVIHLGVTVAVLLLGLSGLAGSRYLSAAADGRQALRLQGENMQLRMRLGNLEQQLQNLQGEMKVSLGYQQRLRLLANLQELDPDVIQAGVGGPSPFDVGASALSPDVRQNLLHTSARVSQLLRQAQIQRESYDQILTALQTKRYIWDHTPSVRPLGVCTISSQYGRRMDPFTGQTAWHRGVDFAAQPGAAIHATAAGVVTISERWGTYGLMVEIDHGDGLHTRYAHCMETLVREGQKVKRGDVIARVGSSGRSSGSHVHYEVVRDGMQQDPMSYVLPSDVVVD